MLHQTYRALFMYVRPVTVVVDKPCPIMTAMAAPSVLTRLAYLTFSICTFAIGDNPSGIQLPIPFNSLDFFNKGSSSLFFPQDRMPVGQLGDGSTERRQQCEGCLGASTALRSSLSLLSIRHDP